MEKRVAIQGVKGCFHEQAARLFYEEHGHIVPEIVECLTFDGLYKEMDKGNADAAVMAIENTVSGGLLPNFELLRKNDAKEALCVYGEFSSALKYYLSFKLCCDGYKLLCILHRIDFNAVYVFVINAHFIYHPFSDKSICRSRSAVFSPLISALYFTVYL